MSLKLDISASKLQLEQCDELKHNKTIGIALRYLNTDYKPQTRFKCSYDPIELSDSHTVQITPIVNQTQTHTIHIYLFEYSKSGIGKRIGASSIDILPYITPFLSNTSSPSLDNLPYTTTIDNIPLTTDSQHATSTVSSLLGTINLTITFDETPSPMTASLLLSMSSLSSSSPSSSPSSPHKSSSLSPHHSSSVTTASPSPNQRSNMHHTLPTSLHGIDNIDNSNDYTTTNNNDNDILTTTFNSGFDDNDLDIASLPFQTSILLSETLYNKNNNNNTSKRHASISIDINNDGAITSTATHPARGTKQAISPRHTLLSSESTLSLISSSSPLTHLNNNISNINVSHLKHSTLSSSSSSRPSSPLTEQQHISFTNDTTYKKQPDNYLSAPQSYLFTLESTILGDIIIETPKIYNIYDYNNILWTKISFLYYTNCILSIIFCIPFIFILKDITLNIYNIDKCKEYTHILYIIQSIPLAYLVYIILSSFIICLTSRYIYKQAVTTFTSSRYNDKSSSSLISVNSTSSSTLLLPSSTQHDPISGNTSHGRYSPPSYLPHMNNNTINNDANNNNNNDNYIDDIQQTEKPQRRNKRLVLPFLFLHTATTLIIFGLCITLTVMTGLGTPISDNECINTNQQIIIQILTSLSIFHLTILITSITLLTRCFKYNIWVLSYPLWYIFIILSPLLLILYILYYCIPNTQTWYINKFFISFYRYITRNDDSATSGSEQNNTNILSDNNNNMYISHDNTINM